MLLYSFSFRDGVGLCFWPLSFLANTGLLWICPLVVDFFFFGVRISTCLQL